MKVSLPGFYGFLLEGLFYLQEGALVCQGEEGVVKVEDYLIPLVGDEVNLFLSYVPPTPLQEERWGGGCCLWEPSGKCPAGHHNVPGLLLRVKESGSFSRHAGAWQIKTPKHTLQVPFEMLEGHTGVITGVKISKDGAEPPSAQETPQVEMLSSLLERLRSFQA